MLVISSCAGTLFSIDHFTLAIFYLSFNFYSPAMALVIHLLPFDKNLLILPGFLLNKNGAIDAFLVKSCDVVCLISFSTVVTVNDYLAQRDAEWMGRVHHFLGLSVGLIQV